MAPDQKGHNPGMSEKAWNKLHKFAAKMNLKYQNKAVESKKQTRGA